MGILIKIRRSNVQGSTGFGDLHACILALGFSLANKLCLLTFFHLVNFRRRWTGGGMYCTSNFWYLAFLYKKSETTEKERRIKTCNWPLGFPAEILAHRSV
jgi:hypothetical protein